jgi:hypothetical protein
MRICGMCVKENKGRTNGRKGKWSERKEPPRLIREGTSCNVERLESEVERRGGGGQRARGRLVQREAEEHLWAGARCHGASHVRRQERQADLVRGCCE